MVNQWPQTARGRGCNCRHISIIYLQYISRSVIMANLWHGTWQPVSWKGISPYDMYGGGAWVMSHIIYNNFVVFTINWFPARIGRFMIMATIHRKSTFWYVSHWLSPLVSLPLYGHKPSQTTLNYHQGYIVLDDVPSENTAAVVLIPNKAQLQAWVSTEEDNC